MGYKYSYEAPHKWLKYHYGKASKCEQCKTSKSPRYEYALLKGKTHEKNRFNYIELCTVCHKKYDRIIERLTKNKYKPVYAEKEGKKYYFSSTKEAVSKLNISKTSISNNLNGLSKTAGGYKWTIV